MRRHPVLTVDLGSTKVACVVAQPNDQHASFNGGIEANEAWEVLGWGLAPYGQVQAAWPDDPSVLALAIEQALAHVKSPQIPDRALVAVTHPQLAHTQVTAHIDLADEPVTIRRRDLERLKAQALGQALSLDRDALVFDALHFAGNGFEAVRDPHELVATRLYGTFRLVSIPSSIKRSITQAFEAVGVEIDQLVYGLQAIAATCQPVPPSTQKGEPTDTLLAPSCFLLLDVGGCCTDLGIVEQGRVVRSSTIPWGGLSIAEALAKACRVSFEQAVQMSLEGLASSKPMVRQVVEGQLRALREAIHGLLKGTLMPDRVIVLGRGALIDGLLEWLETMTERPVVLGRHYRSKALGDLILQSSISQAMGLLDIAKPAHRHANSSARIVDRLLHRTKQILVEYF